MAAPAPAAAGPVPAPASTIDGPSPDILGPSSMSIARDGTGGIVYLKSVAGVAHVFASALVGGVWQAPHELDGAFPGPASQPVVAAGNGGLVIVAFVSGGSLVEVTKPDAGSPYGGPRVLASGAANPSIGMSLLNKSYIAFTATGDGGHDVRAAYYYQGRWGVEPTALDAQPADDAGTGTGRPQVAVSGDGVAIVAWGEDGHIYTRRVWALSPSVAYQQADVPTLGGWSEASSDEPAISTGGDSSYALVAFREVLRSGSLEQTRVLANHLRAGAYDGVVNVDGLGTPGTTGSDQPQVALGEYGRGFVTDAHTATNQVYAAHAGTNGYVDAVFRADSLPNASLPYAVPGIAGVTSTLIAWQHDPGPVGQPEIRMRYAANGSTLGPEIVLSTSAQGPTDADLGLSAGGDGNGDAAVSWIQGASGQRSVMVAQLYQPLGAPSAVAPSGPVRAVRPRLSWTPARADWGPVRYTVSVDGHILGQTFGTSFTVPSPLAQGTHRWHVSASNPAGETAGTTPRPFFVDTVAPRVILSLRGKLRVGAKIRVSVTATDPAPSSGLATTFIRWGPGKRVRIGHLATHVYRKAGRYTIIVTVTDHAGNATTVRRVIRIAPQKAGGRRHGTRR